MYKVIITKTALKQLSDLERSGSPAWRGSTPPKVAWAQFVMRQVGRIGRMGLVGVGSLDYLEHLEHLEYLEYLEYPGYLEERPGVKPPA